MLTFIAVADSILDSKQAKDRRVHSKRPDHSAARMLRKFAGKYGLSAEDIASRLIPPAERQTVIRWWNGTRRPDMHYREQLARISANKVPISAWLTEKERRDIKARERWLKRHPKPSKDLVSWLDTRVDPVDTTSDAATTADVIEPESTALIDTVEAGSEPPDQSDGMRLKDSSTHGIPDATDDPIEDDVDERAEEEFDTDEEIAVDDEDYEDEEDDEDDEDTDDEDSSEDDESKSTGSRKGRPARGAKKVSAELDGDASAPLETESKPRNPPPALPKHHQCSPDDPVERIRLRYVDRYEVVAEDGAVIGVSNDFCEAKRAMDEGAYPGAAAVRCITCKANLAQAARPSQNATEQLVRIAYHTRTTVEMEF